MPAVQMPFQPPRPPTRLFEPPNISTGIPSAACDTQAAAVAHIEGEEKRPATTTGIASDTSSVRQLPDWAQK